MAVTRAGKTLDAEKIQAVVNDIEGVISSAWQAVRRLDGVSSNGRHELDELLAIAATHVETLAREVRRER